MSCLHCSSPSVPVLLPEVGELYDGYIFWPALQEIRISANLTIASSDNALTAANVVVTVATPPILSYTKLLIAYEVPPNVTVPPLTYVFTWSVAPK